MEQSLHDRRAPISAFEVNQDCIAPQFNPSFVAGTTNIQAGEYTPFTLSFGREDAISSSTGCRCRCRRACWDRWGSHCAKNRRHPREPARRQA